MFSQEIKSFRGMCSLRNLRQNWFLPVSAGAFFCLNFTATKASAAAIAIAFLASVLIAACSGPITELLRENRRITGWSAVSAAGISIGVLDSFTCQCLASDRFNDFLARQSWYGTLFDAGRIACCVMSIPFVCFFLVLFWKKAAEFIRRNREITEISKAEIVAYSVLFLLTCAYIIYTYTNSVAFYDTRKYGFLYNTIYTSDSSAHFRPSAYLWPAHEHNDLRQPLFAVFAAPFMGLPYLAGFLFPTPVRAIVMDCAQAAMLLAANLLIVKAMKARPAYRICFAALSACMYSNLLFTVMMEQYIVAYFWLAVVVYAACRCEKTEDLHMLAAGGTMLTSFAMLLSGFRKNIGEWLRYAVKTMLKFIGLLAAFCRFDVILTAFSTIRALTGFAGESVPFTQRLYQFTDFIRGCFLAPAAGVKEITDLNVKLDYQNHAVWAADPVAGVSVFGAVLLCVVLISAVIHRKDKACAAAGGWVLFSVALLAVAGWGTKENGLILYVLYFGWAYLLLLFRLAVTACEKIKAGYGVPVLSAIACIAMLVYNIPAVRQMLLFAFQYYPV